MQAQAVKGAMSAGNKILVIEDEPSIADNIVYALSTDGFEATHCSTAEAARASLKASAPDLILLDVGLPDANGFELAKELRQLKAGVPIIFVTARSEEIDRIVGLEIGADDYVVKPFSPRELTARVKAVLRRAGSPSHTPKPEVKPHPQFDIDAERFLISFLGTALELSRYEYRLLAILVKRPGRVYSREQLMQLAWEEPDMSLERTVDTHIKTIRQKLRSILPDVEVIVTHRGLGYSLKEELELQQT